METPLNRAAFLISANDYFLERKRVFSRAGGEACALFGAV
jgi:hypothetical protein